MNRRLVLLLGVTLLPLVAGDPADFVMWPKGVPPGGIKKTAKFLFYGGAAKTHSDRISPCRRLKLGSDYRLKPTMLVNRMIHVGLVN